jgi:hypothetical protein
VHRVHGTHGAHYTHGAHGSGGSHSQTRPSFLTYRRASLTAIRSTHLRPRPIRAARRYPLPISFRMKVGLIPTIWASSTVVRGGPFLRARSFSARATCGDLRLRLRLGLLRLLPESGDGSGSSNSAPVTFIVLRASLCTILTARSNQSFPIFARHGPENGRFHLKGRLRTSDWMDSFGMISAAPATAGRS